MDALARKTRKTHARGTRLAQPLASSVLEGTLYFVTDEGVIERSNGTIWESYSGAGGGGTVINNNYLTMLSAISEFEEPEYSYIIPGSAGAAGAIGAIGPRGIQGINGLDGIDGENTEIIIQGASGNTVPGGSNTQVQFNDSGVFSGDAGLTYDKATDILTTGALVLTNGQIKFPATQNPSSDPNTFDDYEEGDFTVGLTGDGGGSGATYSFRVGKYIKKGLEVTVIFHFKMTSIGTITGNSILSGFPFASENVTNEVAVAMLVFDAIVTNYIVIIGVVNPNASFGQMVGRASAGTSQANIQVSDIGANGEIKGTMVYRAQG